MGTVRYDCMADHHWALFESRVLLGIVGMLGILLVLLGTEGWVFWDLLQGCFCMLCNNATSLWCMLKFTFSHSYA